MQWLRPLALLSTRAPYRRFVEATKQPQMHAERLWTETKAELMRGTYWPAKMTVNKARLEDFPISHYDDYAPLLQDDFVHAKVSSLTGQAILFWAESSGTTGHRKVFPITPAYRAQFMATNQPLIHNLLQRFAGALRAPVVYFAATQATETSPQGIAVTYISAYNYAHMSPLLRSAYAIPLRVMQDGDTYARYARVFALATDLSAFFAITPMRITAFFEDIERNAEADLELLSGKRALPPGLPPLRIDAPRLALLHRVLRGDRPFMARALWPAMQYACCWTGGICALQARHLTRWMGDVPIVDATFSATEGWVNVPLDNAIAGGPVHTGALITEYIKVGSPIATQHVLKPWQLEAGNDYEILITNKMGLVRYRLKDVLRCTGYFNHSPTVVFVGKADNELSLGLIRLTEEHLVRSITECGVAIDGKWIFAPHPNGDRLALHVERAPDDIVALARSAHARLCEVARFYKRDVDNGVIKPLEVSVLGPHHRFFTAAAHAQIKPKAFTVELA